MGLALAGVFGSAGLLAHPAKRSTTSLEREPARWFIPGPLGFESGSQPAPVGEDAYLTRGLYRLHQGQEGEWAVNNQLTNPPVITHALFRLLPPERFAEDPRLFPKVRGERWAPPVERGHGNWNPDLGEPATALAVAEAIIASADPLADDQFISIGTNDSFHFGDSDAVRHFTYPPRWFRCNPDYSDLVFTFSNRVASHLENSLPEHRVSQLAYYWTELPPRFPVHPKVVPVLATDQSQLYDPTYRQQEWMLLEGWGASGAERLGHWHYLLGSGFLVPRIHVGMLADYYPRARRAGFTDYYAQTNFNWGFDGPQPWIAARLLVEPFGDVEAWLDEYYRRYFRQAAKPMREFFERCEAIWNNQPGPPYWLKHYTNESQADLFPPSVCAELRQLLDQASQRAEGDPKTVARVELTSQAFAVVEAFSRFHATRLALSEALLNGWEKSNVDGLREKLAAYEQAKSAGVSESNAPAGTAQMRGHWQRPSPGGPGRGSPWRFRVFEEQDRVKAPVRGGFLPVLSHVQKEYPWAIGRVLLAHFTVNDPGPTARALLESGAPSFSEADVLQWNGEREGGLIMAGLEFQSPAPPGWQSLIEPYEGGKVEWSDSSSGAVLRLENQKQFDLYRWAVFKS